MPTRAKHIVQNAFTFVLRYQDMAKPPTEPLRQQ